MAYIDIQDLSFSFPGRQEKALDHIHLQIEKGEFVLLCGVSGSGKTTLLRHLKPVLMPYGRRSGRVLLDGRELCAMAPREQAARVGYVMQDPDAQIVTDRVWHELAFGLENLGCDPGTMRLRVAEMANYFGIEKWFHREVRELSGGQKQLLNLAAVMAMQPGLLILDEPVSQLDPIAAADFLNTIRQINRELGTTILITEHRMEEIFGAADRVVVLDQGKMIGDAPPDSVGKMLYERENVLFSGLPAPARVYYSAGFSEKAPLTVRDGRRWLEGLGREKGLTDKPSAESREEPSPWAGKPDAVCVRDAWFRYEKEGPDIVKGLNLHIPRGSIYAIVGGNGAGKSTTLKMLCGLLRPYRGKVELLGKDLKKYKPGELYRNGISMLPQDPMCLFVNKTVGEDLMEMTEDRLAAEETAALCRIRHLLSAHPRDLSGGEVQRAALAKVLLTRPKLLLLDEPTKGIDCGYKREFAALLRQLQRQDITTVMVSHDLEFCGEYADLVGMFFDGGLITDNPPKRFFGSNSFYTTVGNRMSRSLWPQAVTVSDIVERIQEDFL